MNQLMTVQDMADYLKVTIKTVYRLLEKGSIPSTRVGHLWRFDRAAIDLWLLQNSKPSGVRMLVIDDDAVVGSLFEESLRDTGYIVHSVQDSLIGLEMVKNGNYDLIFLDLMMPGIDGASVFKKIRAINPELPVTIITGYPDSELMNNAMANGPFGVMKKPFTASDILVVINNYLRFGITSK
jgi:excisionase family DNA binding protein